MKAYWLLPLSISISSCMVSNGLQYEAMSETNQYHIVKLRNGMSEKQVLRIMHKPYSYESFQVEDDIYDVWFYVTRPTGLDQTRMVAQNLTPLTFKNGILVGTGYNWYYYAMKEQAAEVAAQKPEVEKPKTQEAEDREFEEALKSNPNQTSPSGNSIQKTPSENQKLPPNVHIISKSEVPICREKVCGPNRFSVLAKGMSETQVYNIVGEPLQYETFEIGHDVYDVWVYETVASKSGKPSTVPQEKTFLTFKNAVLFSQSDEEFYRLKELAARLKAQQPVAVTEPAATVVPPQKKFSIFKPYVPKTPLGVTQKSFSKVSKGMTEYEVMDLLGSTSEQEAFSIGDDMYDVWFYQVTPKNKKNPPKQMPLTFKNGKLVGLTMDEYNKLRNQADPGFRGYTRDADRGQEDESEQNFNYW